MVERIADGDHEGAAEQFVETVAFGPGTWEELAPDYRLIFIENARTFLEDARDSEAMAFDLERVEGFRQPVLLTQGDESPPIYGSAVAQLADALPNAETFTFTGAGHIPHRTQPDAFAEIVGTFIREHSG